MSLTHRIWSWGSSCSRSRSMDAGGVICSCCLSWSPCELAQFIQKLQKFLVLHLKHVRPGHWRYFSLNKRKEDGSTLPMCHIITPLKEFSMPEEKASFVIFLIPRTNLDGKTMIDAPNEFRPPTCPLTWKWCFPTSTDLRRWGNKGYKEKVELSPLKRDKT